MDDMSSPPIKLGRPSVYSLEYAARICDQVALGRKLIDICADEDMPARTTVYRWIGEDTSFRDMYTKAREERGDLYADEIVDIADNEPDYQKARVRIDARKWAASKLNQKNYGDKSEVNNNITIKLDDRQVESRLAQLLGKAGVVEAIGIEGIPEGEEETV
jgi:hypothetical protein